MEFNVKKILFLCITVVYLVFFGYQKQWEYTIYMGGDQVGYYSYLPSVFIYGDIKNFDKTTEVRIEYAGIEDFYSHHDKKLQNGNYLNQYTSGVAIIQTIPFLVGHAIAGVTSYPADGFSFPYAFSITIWSIFLVLIAYWLLIGILEKFVSQNSAAITVFLIALGTHILPNTITKGNMSHVYIFSLIVYLIYYLYQIIDSDRITNWLIAGFIAGLIVMSRPSEATILFIMFSFLFVTDFRKKITIHRFLAATILGLIPPVIQFSYWKLITGSFLINSYKENYFDFANPKILEGLFSLQNGFFTYALPMILFPIGLIFLFNKHKTLAILCAMYFAIHVYITYSWDNWYYINGFGSRPMISTFAFLSIPLAFVVDFLIKRINFKLILVSTFVFIAYYCFLSWQMISGILYTEESNLNYFLSSQGRTSINRNMLTSLDTQLKQNLDQPSKKNLGRTFCQFDTSYSKYSFENEYAIINEEYNPVYKLNIENREVRKIRAYADVYYKTRARGIYDMNMLVVNIIDENGELVLWKGVRLNNKLSESKDFNYSQGDINYPDKVYFDIPIPKDLYKYTVSLTIWNMNVHHKTYIKELGIEWLE